MVNDTDQKQTENYHLVFDEDQFNGSEGLRILRLWSYNPTTLMIAADADD